MKNYKFKEFVDLFGGMDKVAGIYIDDKDDTVREAVLEDEYPLSALHTLPNLLADTKYIKLNEETEEYDLDKAKVLSEYGDYTISLYIPVLRDDVDDELMNVEEDDVSEDEYVQNMSQCSEKVEVLMRPFSFGKDKDKEAKSEDKEYTDFYPDMHSDIECWVLTNCVPKKIKNSKAKIYDTKVIGVVTDESLIEEVVKKRTALYTIVDHIKGGLVIPKDSVLYYTNIYGDVEDYGRFKGFEASDEDKQ